MSRSRLWIGLDVGADTMACCVVDDDGKVVAEHSLPTCASALKAVLKPVRRRVNLIALETGSAGTHLARSLIQLGFPVSQFDARQTSKFLGISQNKTDKNDARGLAEIARIGHGVVSPVRLKSIENQKLRSLLVTRQKLVRLRIAIESMIRSLFRLNGGRLKRPTSASTLRRNVTQELSRLRKAEKIDLRGDIEPMLEMGQSMRAYLEHLDNRLSSIAELNPVCQQFMKIPGIGPICALSFYSAIDEPFRFCRNADVGAYLGLTPRIRQSGQSSSRLRISRMGNRMTRAHLVFSAGNYLRCENSAISSWGLALRERVGPGRARVAVARKLAVLMLAIWKSGREYEPYPAASPLFDDLPSREAAGLETVAEPVDGNDPDWFAGQACR